jgi:hypothetical protein
MCVKNKRENFLKKLILYTRLCFLGPSVTLNELLSGFKRVHLQLRVHDVEVHNYQMTLSWVYTNE